MLPLDHRSRLLKYMLKKFNTDYALKNSVAFTHIKYETLLTRFAIMLDTVLCLGALWKFYRHAYQHEGHKESMGNE